MGEREEVIQVDRTEESLFYMAFKMFQNGSLFKLLLGNFVCECLLMCDSHFIYKEDELNHGNGISQCQSKM